MTPGTVFCQSPLSMEFCRQEYWSGLPFPSPGDLPNPGTEPKSPALQVDSFCLSHQGSPINPKLLIYPSSPFLFGNHNFVSFLWIYFFFVYKFICIVLFFSDSTKKSGFVFVWLTSVSKIICKSIHIAANGIILFFLQLIFYCVYVPHLISSIQCQWALRLLSCPGYCK